MGVGSAPNSDALSVQHQVDNIPLTAEDMSFYDAQTWRVPWSTEEGDGQMMETSDTMVGQADERLLPMSGKL